MKYRLHTLVIAFALVALSASASAQVLVTQVAGSVNYQIGVEGAKVAAARAFMKARTGDVFTLENGASVRLVYTGSGRSENWAGPTTFVIGETESTVTGKRAPQVSQLPSTATNALRRVPSLLKRSGVTRMGAGRMRGAGGKERWITVSDLTPESHAELRKAWKIHTEMAKTLLPRDPTADLYLAAVMGRLLVRDELTKFLSEALKRHPGEPSLSALNDWATGKKAKKDN